MSGWVWAVIVAVIVIILIMVAYSAWQKRRREGLQSKFGPEYERTVVESDNRRSAEKELEARQKRRESLNIRELDPATRDRHMDSWRQTQARFVDAPADAVREADRLVGQDMTDRGYPMDNFDQQSADISVDHPDVVDNYRAAHGISLASDQGQATTEDLRQAMVHYRSLFETLLGSTSSGAGTTGTGTTGSYGNTGGDVAPQQTSSATSGAGMGQQQSWSNDTRDESGSSTEAVPPASGSAYPEQTSP